MDDRLILRDFSAGYGRKMVVSEVELSLAPGELGVVLGANGSGKSTLLKGVCGLVRTQGTCLLDGEPILRASGKQRMRKVGYLAQHASVELSLTGMEVVLMGYNPVLSLLERPGSRQKQRAQILLEALGIGDLAQVDVQEMSQGQRQLLLFARTLIREPALLLLDEADSALDYRNRQRFFGLLHGLARRRGVSILLCTHDASLALSCGDRLILMDEGSMVGNIPLEQATQEQLQAGLSRIYGPVEVIRHRDRWILAGGMR